MKYLFYCFLFFAIPTLSIAQARTYTDAAQMYNRLLLDNSNTVVQIGTYKVKGTPYFYGGRNPGKIFINNTENGTLYLSYNTYDQTIEYSLTLGQIENFLKPTGIVDSFIILKDDDLQIQNDIFFVNGKYVFDNKEGFHQMVFNGPQYSLLKKYHSELAIVSTNYVQGDLRQFDLNYDYYYLDVEKKELKKIKPNAGALKKEFKDKIDINSIAGNEDFAYQPEQSLIKIFQALNK